jgi:hypothetical protein
MFFCSWSVENLDGPIMIQNLNHICKNYQKFNKRPLLSLENGIWIGNVPAELSDLSYTEQLLIAGVRHNSLNRCIMKVFSGMHKMIANAIVFENPTPKICNIMPPPLDKLDEILTFIYTGSYRPTKSDLEWTLLLVRRNKVANALNWLKLNHVDYYG